MTPETECDDLEAAALTEVPVPGLWAAVDDVIDLLRQTEDPVRLAARIMDAAIVDDEPTYGDASAAVAVAALVLACQGRLACTTTEVRTWVAWHADRCACKTLGERADAVLWRLAENDETAWVRIRMRKDALDWFEKFDGFENVRVAPGGLGQVLTSWLRPA